MDLLINNLTKTYDNGVKALDGIDLHIKPGMFGLLGPNGAGKSTLMRTIATLQRPDKGTVSFGDIDVLKDPMQLRRVLGYLPQEFGVYPNMSAEDLLDYFAHLKGVSSRVDRKKIVQKVLEITNLYQVKSKSVSGYSGGMKQRFGIAQLLLNDPKLIIVDEPTAGLDPAERQRFLNVLREIGTNHTVIFSTHIVDDVRELCHELAIVNGGKVLYRGSSQAGEDDLRGKIWTNNIDREAFDAVNSQYNVISSSYNRDNSLNIRVYNEQSPGEQFASAEPILEDVYFVSLKRDSQHV
ncbi:ABC transporter ATP-binding protein [Sphingobacterium sp. lm-10]|uniref:ABC transporter ATP-binding protein n=1 Tax=Sphingobacterium sp. lm-10 TaxID=2944904 RepID=UPI002022699E|nr:ABC transporter ATP-binding protein [Sphingobacterium sp. lm-10]MCL7987542.1 ABC transporter ATP-binding protein [Sphingobacterium sp. lm-10]